MCIKGYHNEKGQVLLSESAQLSGQLHSHTSYAEMKSFHERAQLDSLLSLSSSHPGNQGLRGCKFVRTLSFGSPLE